MPENSISSRGIAGRNRNGANRRQTLTSREQQVFEMVGQGYRGREIAARLGIAYGTLRKHRLSILAKFGLWTSGQLAAFAVASRMVDAQTNSDLGATGRA